MQFLRLGKNFFFVLEFAHNLFNISSSNISVQNLKQQAIFPVISTKSRKIELSYQKEVEHLIFFKFLVKFLHRIVLFFKKPYFKFKFLCAEQENLSVSNLFSNKMMGLIPVLSVGPILYKNRKFFKEKRYFVTKRKYGMNNCMNIKHIRTLLNCYDVIIFGVSPHPTPFFMCYNFFQNYHLMFHFFVAIIYPPFFFFLTYS